MNIKELREYLNHLLRIYNGTGPYANSEYIHLLINKTYIELKRKGMNEKPKLWN